MSLLDDLNSEQRAAAEQTQGPVMIIAGAGSGKTRTLTYRIAHLMESGNDAFRILALTFTNKAAKEMRERVTALIGPEAKGVWMGTFHSIFARVLRAEAEKLGYPPTFGIYDTDDSKALIKQIIKEQSLDPKEYPVNGVLHRISSAKNSLVSVHDYMHNAELRAQDSKQHKPFIGELYTLYNERLRKSSAMDFDDLLYNMNVLLRDFPEVLQKYQQRFEYILVDEYQDTNYAQYLIVKKLAAMHQNICVVGDDSQSIYSFRGANIQNILNFEEDYPQMRRFKLEQNYRSTKYIVELSNKVIERNKDRIPKEIWTSNEKGSKVHILQSSTEIEEGTAVAHEIFETKMNEQMLNHDFVVLYRTNNQSKAIEDALRKINIPYRIYGGQSFYKRKEIKDVLAYFRWVVNPQDEDALVRCINNPARGIGQTTLDRLRILGHELGGNMWSAIEWLQKGGCDGEEARKEASKKSKGPKEVDSPNTTLATLEKSLGTAMKVKILQVADTIQSLHLQLSTTDAFTLANKIWVSSGLGREYQQENTPESESRIQNVQELLNAVKEFCDNDPLMVNEETGELVKWEGVVSLDKFLQEISLLTDQDTNQDDESQEKVTLMTIHAAKGLEFPCVFVVGCEENLFPSTLSATTREELEEERRLFYVAVTRSEKKLWLSFSNRRMKWGEPTLCEPSRFLLELDPSCLENPQALEKPSSRTFDDFDFSEDDCKEVTSSASNWKASNTKQGMRTHSISNAVESTFANKIDISRFKKVSQLPPRELSSSTGENGAVSMDTNGNKTAKTDFQVGEKIIHAKFGRGMIIQTQGEGANQKLIIRFEAPGIGEKTLLTQFAKLRLAQ